jgi:trehalose 6-phosphate synthase/phosphatase
VPAYAELRREVSELVGEVNGDFGTPEWQPVVYLRRSLERPELAALYAAADVAWVGPLRDGMNLVAKEYVACQGGRDGVLVLSEFAGAAQELGEALRINPYDQEGTAETIIRALEMDPEVRADRMRALHERVRRDDAVAWGERFLAGLRAATEPARTGARRERPRPDLARLRSAWSAAAHRLVFLDYDGTLVPFAGRPADATPPPELRELLTRLAAGQDTTVALVSGRSRHEIGRWFGDIAGLWLAVEHGALVRDAATGQWRPLRGEVESTWKERVQPVLEQFARSAPGAFVEEKEHSLGWHYRLADAEFGAWLAGELVATLDQLLAGTELAVLHGAKVVEVRYAWANKGEVVTLLRSQAPRASLLLAMGDDRTDEDMFARLPRRAWTMRVGRGSTRARFRVADPAEARGLLALLAEEGR